LLLILMWHGAAHHLWLRLNTLQSTSMVINESNDHQGCQMVRFQTKKSKFG
jgi:hypothetical protein